MNFFCHLDLFYAKGKKGKKNISFKVKISCVEVLCNMFVLLFETPPLKFIAEQVTILPLFLRSFNGFSLVSCVAISRQIRHDFKAESSKQPKTYASSHTVKNVRSKQPAGSHQIDATFLTRFAGTNWRKKKAAFSKMNSLMCANK